MKIWITYNVPTANGAQRETIMTADTFDEADEICEAIERCGYELVDVTRDIYED